MYPLTKRHLIVATLLLAACTSSPAFSSPAPVSSNPSITSSPASRFEHGDLVRLRSGGPAMTVSAVKGDQVECVWTDDSGQPDDASFPADVLQRF